SRWSMVPWSDLRSVPVYPSRASVQDLFSLSSLAQREQPFRSRRPSAPLKCGRPAAPTLRKSEDAIRPESLRSRSMWRATFKIATCLLLGALTSVAMAWGFALRGFTSSAVRTSVRQFTCSNGDVVVCNELDRTPASRLLEFEGERHSRFDHSVAP